MIKYHPATALAGGNKVLRKLALADQPQSKLKRNGKIAKYSGE